MKVWFCEVEVVQVNSDDVLRLRGIRYIDKCKYNLNKRLSVFIPSYFQCLFHAIPVSYKGWNNRLFKIFPLFPLETSCLLQEE